MTKRLCELFQIESNTKDCVVFTLKPETSPLDLVKLGGFEGHECMLRMSKNRDTTCITVFRDGDEPYHMNYGSSTTLVGEDRRKVRDLIMEMANLDFGIVTGGRGVRSGSDFDRLVERTSGPRDLDSLREFELIKTPAGDGSLFVNNQHVAHVCVRDIDQWLAERNIAMLRGSYEQPSGNGCTIVKGEFRRMETERRIGVIQNGVVYPGMSAQGLIYKDEAAFEKGEGICYVPEYGLDPDAATVSGGFLVDECETYTYSDIVRACEGNEEAARQVFARLDWQHPETLYRESLDDFMPEAPSSPQVDARVFSDALDKAFNSFLAKTGWRGLDAATAVGEFVRFAKQDLEPSLDDLMTNARVKAAERNGERSETREPRKTPEMGR